MSDATPPNTAKQLVDVITELATATGYPLTDLDKATLKQAMQPTEGVNQDSITAQLALQVNRARLACEAREIEFKTVLENFLKQEQYNSELYEKVINAHKKLQDDIHAVGKLLSSIDKNSEFKQLEPKLTANVTTVISATQEKLKEYNASDTKFMDGFKTTFSKDAQGLKDTWESTQRENIWAASARERSLDKLGKCLKYLAVAALLIYSAALFIICPPAGILAVGIAIAVASTVLGLGYGMASIQPGADYLTQRKAASEHRDNERSALQGHEVHKNELTKQFTAFKQEQKKDGSAWQELIGNKPAAQDPSPPVPNPLKPRN